VRLAANTVHELGTGGASDMAAGLAYYALLSVFPLVLGAVALLGVFLPSEVVQRELFTFFARHLPTSTDLLRQNISNIIALRSTLGAVSLFGLFWSGSAIFGAIGRVVNRAWGIQRFRPFYVRKLRDLSLAAGTSLLFLVSLALKATMIFFDDVELPVLNALTAVVAQLLAFSMMLIVFLLIYRFMPNARIEWRQVWPGAILATVLFEAARTLFVLYVGRFAHYELVYGSIASIIIFVVWMYISAFLVILGAEFNSEYAKMVPNREPDGVKPVSRFKG
jgi:membrane protein